LREGVEEVAQEWQSPVRCHRLARSALCKQSDRPVPPQMTRVNFWMLYPDQTPDFR
jgi:hypothetical protein